MPKKRITSKDAPKPIGPYSQGVISGGLLVCPGQIAIEPKTSELVTGDVVVQTEQVLKNLLAILKEAKMGPENVVKTTVYLADMADFPKMNEVDRLLRDRPALQRIVYEAHPELAFARMNGGKPVLSKKRQPDGYVERRKLLARHGFGFNRARSV